MTTEWFWPALTACVCLALVFHRALGSLIRLGLRTLAGAFFLALAGPLGLGLGVNLLNALTLGILGAPGFGLLLLLRWMTLP